MNLQTPRLRRFTPTAWLRLAAIVAVAVLLALPPVRAAATSFLKLFRVQKVTVLPVDPDNFMGGDTTALEQIISSNVQTKQSGDAKSVHSSTEATSASGLRVRLPAAAPGQPRIKVMPATEISFKVDLARVQDVLQAMGKDISLPESLDGAEISARLSPVVVAAYGTCGTDESNQRGGERQGGPEGCTVLTQTASPDVSAPAGLPIDELGRTYLELMGMSPEEATRFGEQVDWTSTLVIPVPLNSAATREVQVDGVSGTLIENNGDEGPRYFLIWLKDGVLYAVAGSGAAEEGLTLAQSLGTQEVQAAPGGPTE